LTREQNLKNKLLVESLCMTMSNRFRDDLIAAIPSLRAFGFSLTSRSDRADDLVQETLMKAWKHQSKFEEGTNIKAWLYTILRNEFYSQLRKRRREVEDADGQYSGRVLVQPQQLGHLDMADLKTALQKLPDDQREAIILVGASGFSYEEAADICGVATGTIKSRVSRARAKLSEMLKIDGANEFYPDRTLQGIIGGSTFAED
jgi:RNA polymerase sigma-70 factor, ECF subfamily